ncbi:MAG TPA: DNA internalization-related competence protein ComEC/Rec2 [Candidatus Mediterraneibacter gallistercoris]|uniref:DNA internalization-related competence protein ComEC/Rec2 n=1 Tax=Candidatus Mediterraneibacter gallistercoris TaxID=2838671 RepID=A0A9D2P4F7_9FIRM|nr:DNA internalization-related competence protein ComEC/Rec2 [Candidatus Mediterraneibacter gallistercoris]
MKKRPLCAICILFLVIQGIRVFFFGVEDMEPSALEKAVSYGEKQVELAGAVYRIEEKERVTAVFLKDSTVSVADQIINESEILVYISKNETEKSTAIKIGNRVAVSGEAATFEPARNPGNFDQKAYYMRQGIHVLVWAKQIRVQSFDTRPVRQFLSELREKWNNLLIRHLGKYYGGTMSAVLLGEKSGLDAEMKTMYQKCGISHLLAISGLHMTFLGMGIYNLLRKAGCGFIVSGLAGGVLLVLYSMMIGAGVSSLRALIMFLVRIGAEITGRDYDLLTSLFLSAAILCFRQPLYLTDAGFQLSYGAILGIALLGPVFSEMFGCANISAWKKRLEHKKKGRFLSLQRKVLAAVLWIMNGLCTSLAVNVLLLGPMLWFYFEIPPYSVSLNLIVIPVMPAAMGAGVIGSAASLLSDAAGGVVLQVCRWVLRAYDQICTWACRLPGNRFVAGKPELLWLAVYYLVLFAFWLSYRYIVLKRERAEEKETDRNKIPNESRKLCRLPGCGMLLFAACMALLCRISFQWQNEVQVTVLDVGQGDGIHIRNASLNCLIDGGSSDVTSVGTYRLEPYFLSQGVDTIDYIFVTHGDDDHISGVQEMLENQMFGVKIRNLVMPSPEHQDEKLIALAQTAVKNGIRVAVMDPGDEITSDGAEEEIGLILTCIGPESGLGVDPGNETSLVLDLSYGEFDMLFTGDVEGAGEEKLISSGRLRDYDVLKAAHHGSKNSGTEKFLELTQPEYAVISAGVDNRYGHPHTETLQRFSAAGCAVCSTQDNGAVTIRSDGEKMTIQGFITE